jgi:hypothetical protein
MSNLPLAAEGIFWMLVFVVVYFCGYNRGFRDEQANQRARDLRDSEAAE